VYTAVRIDWRPEDPEIVSDVLFAVANVMSIARTTYLMPAFEVLGPLQISLGRMLGDITRFLVLFTLVRILIEQGLTSRQTHYKSYNCVSLCFIVLFMFLYNIVSGQLALLLLIND